MAGNELGEWYRAIPQLTRWWFTASVVLPLLGRFGFLSFFTMILTPEFITSFHIWRPVTAVFYYPITPQTGFHYLINLYFLYSYSSRLETDHFPGKPADYATLLIFNWMTLVVIGLFIGLTLLMDSMVLSVLYVWCQLNSEVIVQFWFGAQFKAQYLPWVLFVFNFIIKGSGLNEILGILVGHLYFFLAYKYPQEGGRELIWTPSFLKSLLPDVRGGFSGFGQPPRAQTAQRDDAAPGPDQPRRRHDWGAGQQLG